MLLLRYFNQHHQLIKLFNLWSFKINLNLYVYIIVYLSILMMMFAARILYISIVYFKVSSFFLLACTLPFNLIENNWICESLRLVGWSSDCSIHLILMNQIGALFIFKNILGSYYWWV